MVLVKFSAIGASILHSWSHNYEVMSFPQPANAFALIFLYDLWPVVEEYE